MQDENLRADMPVESVEDLFLGTQETYEQAQARALEENKAFAKTEYFRMDKLGVYRLRILPIAPQPDGTTDRKSYEYPVRQMLMEIEKPSTGGKPGYVYVSVPRATDAGYPVDVIDTYRKAAVEQARDQGDEKLAEKIGGGSFGGGLKYSYGHSLYMFDLGERAKGIQLLTLSHSQFKDLDERKFKLWQKKLSKNPHYPCPISSVQSAYPVEIEKKKNGNKTEYVIGIDNESDVDVLSREELTALMAAPRIPEVIYRYTRYHFEATLEFLRQCDGKYGLAVLETQEVQEAIATLQEALPQEDKSSFSFDKRSKDAKENAAELSFDDLTERFAEISELGLGDKTEEGQELRALIRTYIEQEGLKVRITRATTNYDLLQAIEDELAGEIPAKRDTPATERRRRG